MFTQLPVHYKLKYRLSSCRMGGVTLTLLLLCLSGTLSEDAGEDNLNDIMVQIQPEQGQDIENEYKTHNQHSEQEQDIESEVIFKQNQAPSLAETNSSCQPDMCNVLRHLGAMEARLTTAENQVEELSNMEAIVALLQRETEFQAAELRVMETKLSTSESLMRSMKRENEVQERKLQVLSYRVNATEFRVEQQQILLDELRRQNEDGPKIAFTAALGGDGHILPSERETNLAFSNVLTNVGDAYNPGSGVFNAPVKGVYYFSFSAFAYSQHNVCISLFKNNMRMLSACDHHSEHDRSDSSGNGGTLHLEQGDHVYMTLHAHSHIFADDHNRSTFRGFLLFRT
uniref:C1q domain-containing protein n=1 Tax=Hucho hucho TaxID=62062 RepID=A0A4W5RKH2_9TELE